MAGLLAPGALDRPDLNGEPLTPLDPEAQQPREAEVGGDSGEPLVFAHLPGNSTLVLPFAALMRWEGATLTSVSIRLGGGREEIRRDLEELARTLDLNLFAGLEGRRLLINTVGAASVSGLAGLAVPLLIAALIVLNTMLGAVWERTREIGTFNAVGLAPAHVSGLFMAEAVALGVVGAVAGYLLGQTAAQLLGHRGWLQGLELNYSSLAAVLTLGSVVLLVAASALYPAHLAGRICTPGIERRWSLPAGFEGDRLEVPLPFSLPRGEALGLAAFQAEFWAEHREQSIGAGFYVESIDLSREKDRLGLAARVWLAPFDQGVVQRAELRIRPGHGPPVLRSGDGPGAAGGRPVGVAAGGAHLPRRRAPAVPGLADPGRGGAPPVRGRAAALGGGRVRGGRGGGGACMRLALPIVGLTSGAEAAPA